MASTNYFETFIQTAEDCPVTTAEVPPAKGTSKSVALLQYEMIANNPYKFTQDDVLFEVHAQRKGISEKDQETEREKFFSKGQACLRASSLTKRYGWGVHNNSEGKIALFAMESKEYLDLVDNPDIKQLKAMRSKRV